MGYNCSPDECNTPYGGWCPKHDPILDRPDLVADRKRSWAELAEKLSPPSVSGSHGAGLPVSDVEGPISNIIFMVLFFGFLGFVTRLFFGEGAVLLLLLFLLVFGILCLLDDLGKALGRVRLGKVRLLVDARGFLQKRFEEGWDWFKDTLNCDSLAGWCLDGLGWLLNCFDEGWYWFKGRLE